MKRRTHAAAAMLWALLAFVGLPGQAQAQGVVTGAISGRVSSPDGEGLAGAQVTIRNGSIGLSRTVVTDQDGRYRVASLPVGGPYTVGATLVGRTASQRTGLNVALGQDLRVDITLGEQAVVLEAITVSGEANPILSPTSQGLSTNISEQAIERLPTLNRNFTDFVRLAPQVSQTGPGLSGGGVNNRFNNIQIDGASENDLFGLGTTGQPGGQAGGKSISIESVKEYQILLSPYDVRQGNFAGLLVNAVTKSGTNDFDGAVYYFTRNQDLTREQTYINDYEQTQYGFAVGGPIIRDRLHFFVNPEWQDRTTPAGGPFFGQSNEGTTPISVTQAQVDEFRSILEGYGIEGGSETQINNDNPLTNFFGRLDLQLPEWNSRMVLRHNYGRAEDDNFSRSATLFNLSSNGYYFESTKNSTVAQLFTNFSDDLYNELIIGYSTIRDSRTPNVFAPSIRVDAGSQDLIAGGEQFSQGNTLDQDIFEITNNLSWQRGDHRIDIGTKNEFYHLDNFFAESAFGVYEFNSLADFRNGVVSTYRLAANGRDANLPIPHAEFSAAQYGLYVQDFWEPSDRFSLTFGLRADMPVVFDEPAFTQLVQDVFNRNTSEVPSGNIQFSPRVGFNLDLSGDNSTQVRGGAGVFVGRPAFVMVGNAFQNDGTGVAFLTCGGTTGRPAPAFNPDPENQPQQCANGQGLGSGIVGAVNLLDEDFTFPASFRSSLAFDHELPHGWVASLEGLYTRAVSQYFYNDLNLKTPQGLAVDKFGRTLFGTIPTGGVPPAASFKVDNRFNEVIEVTNQNEDWAYNLSAGLQRRFESGFELSAFYTFSKARDVISATSSRAISNYRFGRVLYGPHTDRGVGISSFDQPHKITLSAIYNRPWGRGFLTSLSVLYTGRSGDPFTYVYGGTSGRGDLNADGLQGNDAIYVPTDATDPTQIRFQAVTISGVTYTPAEQAAAFNEFIDSSSCLSKARGEILERNACRNGWVNFVDVSLRQSIPTLRRQAFSVQLDVFNFLNLLNEDWGQVRNASGLSTLNLVTHRAMSSADPATAVPVVDFNPTFVQFDTNSLGSNYQIQLSARYEF
jgi:hypothetical protein